MPLPPMADRITQLKALLEAEPTDTFCMYGLAMEHAKLGNPDEAIRWFDKTITTDPNYCYAYFHKAKTQEDAGDVEGAKATLRVGARRAKECGDGKAMNEITGYLDELDGAL